jgi:hypothetical protein
MVKQPVALRLPSLPARKEEEARVLAGAVVAQLGAVLGPALEVVGRGAGAFQERADDDELFRERLVGGARDRQFLLGQAKGDEGKSLERLRRRADEADDVRIAPGLRDLAVAHDDGVHEVARLHETPSGHGYIDRVHEEELFPSFPR